MKIQADYTKTRMDALYAVHLQDEYRQSVAEGKDIEEYQALFCAVDRMPLDEHKAAMADVLSEIVLNAPMKEGYAYEEPSDLEGIRRLRPGKDAACGCGNKALEETPGLEEASRNAAEGVSESSGKGAGKWDEEALRDKIHGAWMGRICGCLLGKRWKGYAPMS